LIHEYSNRVYHVDLYRLDDAASVARLGLEELFDRDAITLIEWGERFPELLPENRIEIRISARADGSRDIEMSSAQQS
jgi:tRNA threonylcarbamoyladenosine biosynthesis protein TsaE